MVDADDYAGGFEQGFRAVRGPRAHLPHIPYRGHVPYGMTAFQLGLLRGVERGKGWDSGSIRNANTIA